jgi:amidohydrolase
MSLSTAYPSQAQIGQTYVGAAQALMPAMVELRRAIHAEPEIGLHNPKTSAKVRADLADLPLEWRAGPSTSGLVAVLRGGGGNGRTVLLRGDTDALPLQEQTGLDFASSVEGAMHACGHDSHTAMLAGAARLLSARREDLNGDVVFMFQPGEEGYHGARFMIEDGLLDPMPDAAFALHVQPNGKHGVFSGKEGALLASTDALTIVVTGQGGHASMPQDALDPIPVACEIVSAIQAMVTRQISVFDPAVVTIGKIESGSTYNIIPDTATMIGTIRTLSPTTRTKVKDNLQRLAQGIAAAHGASASVSIETGYPVTMCDGAAVAFGREIVRETFGDEAWRDMRTPLMGGEDFAYVLERAPGAMFFLGAASEGDDWTRCCALHSARMVLDESVMARGAALHAALAHTFLLKGFAA